MVSLEDAASGAQRLSPPKGGHTRTKSGMGSIVVDMGNRGEVEVRAMDLYSPNKKAAARPDPTSRIHFIPLLMVVVFLVLWAGSTEVPLGEDLKLGAATVTALQTNLATSGQQTVESSQHDSQGTELHDHDHGSHKHASRSIEEKVHMQGTLR